MTDRPAPKVGDVEVLPIDEAATIDLANTNKHTQRGGGLLENSLRRRGANRSVASAGKGVVTPVLTAGNYTYEKAVTAGFEKVMNVYTDGKTLVNVVRLDVAPGTAEAIALSIEDNEVGKISYAPDIDLIATLAAGDSAILSALKNEDKIFGGMLDNMTPQQIDYQAEWQGMPEFEQEDRGGIAVVVHFLNTENRAEFFNKLGIDFTDKTKSIWYPERPEEFSDQLGEKAGLVWHNES